MFNISDEAQSAFRIWNLIRGAILILVIVAVAYGVTRQMRTMVEDHAGKGPATQSDQNREIAQ